MKSALVLVVPALALLTFDSPLGPISACVLPLIALLAPPTVLTLTTGAALAAAGTLITTDTALLAVTVFVVILQFTVVSERRWPALVTLVVGWLVGAGLYLGLLAATMPHPFLGSLLAAIILWQLLLPPIKKITSPTLHLLTTNLTVLAAAIATHVILLDLLHLTFTTTTITCTTAITLTLAITLWREPATMRTA